jgi:hypothetical protein
MEHKPTDHSLVSFYGGLVYAEGALMADELTASLAGPVTACIVGFEPLNNAELALFRQGKKLGARRAAANRRLDDGLRALQTDLLGEVKQDTRSEAYKRLFEEGIREATKPAMDRQIEIAQEKVAVLIGSGALYSEALIEEHGPKLKALIAEGEQVAKDQQAYEIAAADLRVKTTAWKEEANAVLLSAEGELLKIAAARKEKRAWVNTFFE